MIPRQQGKGKQSIATKSKRAIMGKLDVIEGKCPHCGHHKMIVSQSFTKCAKCKRWTK